MVGKVFIILINFLLENVSSITSLKSEIFIGSILFNKSCKNYFLSFASLYPLRFSFFSFKILLYRVLLQISNKVLTSPPLL